MLLAEGRRIAFLSRGYGGKRRDLSVQVDVDRDGPAAVGDEPLLAALAPTFVAAVASRAREWQPRLRRGAHHGRRVAEPRAREGPGVRRRGRRGASATALPSGRAVARAAELQALHVNALIVLGGDAGGFDEIRAPFRESPPSARASSLTRWPPPR